MWCATDPQSVQHLRQWSAFGRTCFDRSDVGSGITDETVLLGVLHVI